MVVTCSSVEQQSWQAKSALVRAIYYRVNCPLTCNWVVNMNLLELLKKTHTSNGFYWFFVIGRA